jgi:predicted nucleic acid-binding Zn ribbon protein
MPIEGMPDPDWHRICRRCGKWFEPDEGTMVLPEGRFANTYLTSTGSVLRFQCHGCTRSRRRNRLILWLTLAALVALASLLSWLFGPD